MEQPSSHDELTVMHQFDRLCQLSLDGETVNYHTLSDESSPARKGMYYGMPGWVQANDIPEKP